MSTVNRPKSAAIAKREETFSSLNTFLQRDGMKQRLAMALPKHLTPDRMVRIALSAASRQPLLLECTIESIALSLIRSAEFGLEPDGWDAHLVPYKNKGVRECQLIPDYKGLMKLAYQSELVVSISAGAVREGDFFEYERGTTEYLRHRPSDKIVTPPPQLTHAWACAAIKNGGATFVVLTRREVYEHRDASPAAGSEYSPWARAATEPSMWKKTAVRELAKFLPRSASLREALKHEEAMELGGEVIEGVVFDAPALEAREEAEREPGPSRTEQMSERLGKKSETPKTGEKPEPRQGLAAGEVEMTEAEILAAMQSQYDACQNLEEVFAEYDVQSGPDGWLRTEGLRARSRDMYHARKAALSGKLPGMGAEGVGQ